MSITWYELNEIENEKLKYVVVISKYRNELILIRNKNHDIWELPGGKIEQGELIMRAASRELYEETGAVVFEISPIAIYSMNDSFGMVFYAEVEELVELPKYEIAEVILKKLLPDGLKYGDVYYRMYERVNESMNHKEMNKYKVRYQDKNQIYYF